VQRWIEAGLADERRSTMDEFTRRRCERIADQTVDRALAAVTRDAEARLEDEERARRSMTSSAVLNPIRTMQLLLGRPGGIRLWRLLMILRFRSRDAATALLRPLCRCPGPLGRWAVARRRKSLESMQADARQLLYLVREL